MSTGWIGVDLDGTLAHDDRRPEWDGYIGQPIPTMVMRVRGWLASGLDVRIVTARVAAGNIPEHDPRYPDRQRLAIQAWCVEHLGKALAVTCEKDYRMIELWDDRAVQVIPNTGQRADGKA